MYLVNLLFFLLNGNLFPEKKVIYSFLEVNENTKIMHGLYTCKVLKIGIYDSWLDVYN